METLGVDIGGTFTDFVLVRDGKLNLHKRLSTPDDPARALLEGVEELGRSTSEGVVVHGSTIATNALLERRGARTALITTRGFADILEIGRQNRPDLYALVPRKPPPLVPRQWRFELTERVTATSDVLVPLDPVELDSLIPRLAAEGIESIAVCFLFSFLHPDHERQVSSFISRSSFKPFISLSSDILPEYREYERASTTVINAYVTPLMDRYLSRLEAGLAPRTLRIMQSNGGAITASTARSEAARTVLSGPAGGVVAAFEVARQVLTPPPSPEAQAQERGARGVRLITFDMGGTSADVALCPGRLPLTSEGEIGGMPFRLPIIDIHTVGAGGGSLARVDSGGALLVGPESAGADPGPVCYGRGGTVPTVTDANLILGRLDPAHFLDGRMALDEAAARGALQELASEMGQVSRVTCHACPERSRRMPHGMAVEAAWGVIQVVNAAMERAIRRVSVERGYDPRDFAMVAFGGAGPLHACELAGRLAIPRVVVPRTPGVLSALGMLIADVVKDYSQTIMRPIADLSDAELAAALTPLQSRSRQELSAEQIDSANVRLELSADVRYVGQSFEINVPVPSRGVPSEGQNAVHDLRSQFDLLHAQRYGHSHPLEPAEVVNVRVKAVGASRKPEFELLPAGGEDASPAEVGRKPVWFGEGGWLESILYRRDALLAGNLIPGPAVLFQLDATTSIPPGWRGVVHATGHLILDRL